MLKLAFYKGGKSWFDKLVRWRTNGRHTHVEIVFSSGFSFSADWHDGGTRFKRIEYGPDWDLVPVDDVNEKKVLLWCHSEAGKRYDWRGILGFFAAEKSLQSNERWFCSEACCAALQASGLFVDLIPSQTSPEALWIAATARAESA